MDKDWKSASAFKSERQISDKSAATKMPSRLSRRSFLIVFGIVMAGGLLNANTARAKDCDTLTTKQECCSDKKCESKVLSNKDAHNCKDSSKGKSWHRASDGTTAASCTRL